MAAREILRKDKKDISKKVGETYQRLKNYKILILLIIVILQKNTSEVKSYISIKEVNSTLAKNTLKFLTDPIETMIF